MKHKWWCIKWTRPEPTVKPGRKFITSICPRCKKQSREYVGNVVELVEPIEEIQDTTEFVEIKP